VVVQQQTAMALIVLEVQVVVEEHPTMGHVQEQELKAVMVELVENHHQVETPLVDLVVQEKHMDLVSLDL
tara:strand:+ start:1594 stop:1803 length:210 start_codon:yes stop_codon:yes gene_type:complete